MGPFMLMSSLHAPVTRQTLVILSTNLWQPLGEAIVSLPVLSNFVG